MLPVRPDAFPITRHHDPRQTTHRHGGRTGQSTPKPMLLGRRGAKTPTFALPPLHLAASSFDGFFLLGMVVAVSFAKLLPEVSLHNDIIM